MVKKPWLRLFLLVVPALSALAIVGCGGQTGRPTLPTADRGLTHPPLGCTHHLVFANHAPPNGKVIALSFDDGPSPSTKRIYATLVRYHVPGTFFMTGERVAALSGQNGGAGLLRKMVDHGMELGNHSYTHPRDLPSEGEGASLQLELTNQEIDRTSGFAPCLFRPPYGYLTPELVQRAKVLGMTTVKWDVDAEDWTHPGVSVIRERVLDGARPGGIVVLHDNVETRGQTVQALPGIIVGLEERGYHLVTITQLLGDHFLRHIARPGHTRATAPVRESGGE